MANRPNVILITTDQQRKDSLGCYGSDFVHTPNLDQLAAGGAVFERAYCTNPVCTPSRASLYSGRYVGNHGAWNVGTKILEDEVLLPHRFHGHGYRTHHIGKAHFQPYFDSPENSRESKEDGWESNFTDFHGPYYGFDTVELCVSHALGGVKGHYGLWVKERHGSTVFESTRRSNERFGGEAYDWDIPVELHNSKWVSSRAVEFLKDMSSANQPFFLSLGFQDPHHPHALPRERSERLKPENVPLPQYTLGELEDKPPHFKDVHEGKFDREHVLHGDFPMAGQSDDGANYGEVSEEDARLGRAYYYGMVELIDEAMGEILSALDEFGLIDDTIIVFTSDHGELLGDHGIWMKGPFHYEQLINVPLIIQWKGHINCRRIPSVTSLVDIAPTLLGLCGINSSERLDGVDISASLQGKDGCEREHALIECIDDPTKLRLKTIVTEHYKLSVYYGDYGRSYGELLDLSEDPKEIYNHWNNAAYGEIKSDLLLRMLHELEKLETRNPRMAYA